MKTLCVYCTRTGITEKISKRVADKTGAELLRITDGKNRSGFFGYIAAAAVGLNKTLPKLLEYKTAEPLETYDKIILASPVWCEDISPIMRSFIAENSDRIKGEVYIIATHMSGISYSEKAEKLKENYKLKLVSFFSVKTRKYDWTKDTDEFVKIITHK